MTVIGNKKQETKITEIGTLTTKMFPEVDTLTAKGAFRFGIKNALKDTGYKDWQEVGEQTPSEREIFFETFLEKSLPYLINSGLSEKQAKKLFVQLKKENKKYLK
jgi:hypothetical protein